ncbi:DUF2759 family protein [Brevibacillus laterosporus]|uniref:DUF2759 family protein n=1 Tax=Brevibacillus halotolerans TaxID=1507437 RepID=A0ABT4HXF8_9BACL|nr:MULTISPECIES: DUF2759 family protein [Brevibacillus]MCR8985186.1 DUF2759 family protein [Brevibacillus laterosporus]MCZ0830915.1 DUF2759 family protein [Brevibacillus halotolerans]GIO00177.1 hypothetical protein J5TS2_08450 [Brevibacillus halotolerans]
MQWVMDVTMFLITLFIFAGVFRSIKAKNRFATAFGLVSLAVFVYADFLILKFATGA